LEFGAAYERAGDEPKDEKRVPGAVVRIGFAGSRLLRKILSGT